MTAECFFIDTNILVYANDTSVPEKQEAARNLIRDAVIAGSGVISAQVLSEFWVTATQKMKNPLDRELARKQIALFSSFTIVPIDHETFLRALIIQEKYFLSFWDSQIIAAAYLSGAGKVYSEDMQHSFTYDGVTVQNPFLS